MGRLSALVVLLLLMMGVVVVGATVTRRQTTSELLECRANLSSALKNDETFLQKVRQADFIFTGKIKDMRHDSLRVKVKRAIKGHPNATLDLYANDTCANYIRNSYTGIFMGKREPGLRAFRHVPKVVMHFGPVPLTLANLDRLNAAIKGWFVISVPSLKKKSILSSTLIHHHIYCWPFYHLSQAARLFSFQL